MLDVFVRAADVARTCDVRFAMCRQFMVEFWPLDPIEALPVAVAAARPRGRRADSVSSPAAFLGRLELRNHFSRMNHARATRQKRGTALRDK
jgi:hypothetical protein